MPTVAITDDFLAAMERLPHKVQRKARAFLTKFREDPTSSAINYEKITAADPRVRTVRIGIDYRGIVLHPDEGDIYVLAYVEHHDVAMDWASKKRFDIHPRTGALQVIPTNVAEEAQQALATESAPKKSGLFAACTRDQLFDLGIPEVLLPAVAEISTEKQLDQLAAILPAEASEALYGLAAGMSYVDVLAEIERQLLQPNDLAAALAHPDTQRRIAVVDNDASLQAMLDAPLAKWRIFLHPTQRKLVARSHKGSAKVTGGAGTGKTVVAMHRAVHLAKSVHTDPNDRILFTTFTKNLAQVVGQHIKQLDESAAQRIAVRNLHSVAHEILRQTGMKISVLADDQEIHQVWSDALTDCPGPDGFTDPEFYADEYKDVILAQGITDLDSYLVARRVGRKGRLTRPQRDIVWRVCQRFTELCAMAGNMTYAMMVAKAAEHLAEHKPLPYRALVIDESQDLTANDWRFVRSLVPEGPNDLFLVGDAHQRIYGAPVALTRCGIDIRGRSTRLRVNYRTTQQIRRFACDLLAGLSFDDLDGNSEKQDGYTSLLNGPIPERVPCANMDAQLEAASAKITACLAAGARDHEICCVARHARTRTRIAEGLRQRRLTACPLDAEVPSDSEPGIRVATMHRVKGLEFKHVIIFDAHLNAGDAEDPRERCLYYVAATRARESLMVLLGKT